MSKKHLLERLVELQSVGDTEMAYSEADDLIVSFLRSIGHDDIADEYEKIDKWYA